MPLTSPKSKTYSNPSWTMAIASDQSPLSRWWGASLEQISGFKLDFNSASENSASENSDSDRAEPDQRVSVRGDQAQLEALSHLTESYVQSLLVQSATLVSSPQERNSLVATTLEDDPTFPDDPPEWQADTGYCHRLYLGALQVEPLVSELKVTTSQLYDLSEILNTVLKAVQPQVIREFPTRSPAWPKTAAAAAVAVALTSGVAWYVGGPSFQTASDSERDLVSLDTPQGESSSDNGLDLPPTFQVEPVTPPKASSKTSPSANTPVTVLPPSQKLDDPTSKSVTSNSRKPSSSSSAQSGASSAKKASKTQPETSQSLTSQTSSAQKAASTQSADSKNVKKQVSQPGGTSSPKAPPAESLAKPKNAEKPSQKLASSGVSTPATISESESAQSEVAQPKGAQSEVAQSDANQVAVSPAPSVTPSAPAAVSRSTSSVEGLSAKRRDEADFSGDVDGPSVETVLTFFQSQWRGQDALDQSLSYRIEVQPDGTVRTVTPKDGMASAQIEQTPVPSAGASLTDPFPGPNSALFEVTLYPDGTVSVK